MSGLDSILRVTIDRNTTTPSRTGFGVPLVAAYFPTSVFAERVQAVSSLQEMLDLGFVSTDPAYLAVGAIFAQDPSPGTVKIGRRALAPQQIIQIYPDAPVVGEVHTVTVSGYKDVAFAARGTTGNYITDTFSLTITTETDEEDIVDAFVAGMTETGDYALSKSGTGSSAVLVVTAGNSTMDGLLFRVTTSATMTVYDQTDDPGIVTDLDAIELYDPDWYALCLDSNSVKEITGTAGVTGAANWVVTNAPKFLVTQTADYPVSTVSVASDTTSIAYHLANNNNDRTVLFFHRDNQDYVCAAMLGRALPETPGSITWAWKDLTGVSAQTLNTTELGYLMGSFDTPGGKYVNALLRLNSLNHTRYGWTSGGEFADVMRGTDWLKARIQEDVYAALVQNDKLPLTDAGINVIAGVIQGRLDEGVNNGFLAPDPAPTVVVPRASEISAADKAERRLSGVVFRAYLAGAIHFTEIQGELNL